MDFGSYVRQLREQRREVNRRYSVRQTAQRIGVEPAYLSKIERGDVSPPLRIPSESWLPIWVKMLICCWL